MLAAYHHTQFAPIMILILVAAAAVCFIGAYFTRLPIVRWSIAPIGIVMLALAGIFSTLTIDVGEQGLVWYFGPGLWKYQLARSDITRATVVRNEWTYGFGIRMAPGFRLYNVEGLDAVQLQLKDGSVIRLGSDEAAALAASLKP